MMEDGARKELERGMRRQHRDRQEKGTVSPWGQRAST